MVLSDDYSVFLEQNCSAKALAGSGEEQFAIRKAAVFGDSL